MLRQEHQGAQALTAFAQASDAAGEDQTAEEALLQAGANEGLRVNSRLSLLSDISVAPVFEDTTVYVLDSKLDATFPVPPSDTSLLPPPRSSLASQGMVAYHLHLNYLPTASGFFQVRNTEGTISVPATNSIVTRNTNDYSFNFGLNPTVHLGTNVVTFNSGVQVTVRRDFDTPVQLNQNLFREFTYVSTSSFFNLVSVSGFVLHEAGPFTEADLHSSNPGRGDGFPGRRALGQDGAGDGLGGEQADIQPAHQRELLHLLLCWAGTAFWRAAGCEGAGRRPACVAHRGGQLGHCAGGAAGRHGAVLAATRNWTLQADGGLLRAPAASTTTMRCRAVFLLPMRCPFIADSRKRQERFRCSIRFVSPAASSRRVSSISPDRIVSSSGLISISVCFRSDCNEN